MTDTNPEGEEPPPRDFSIVGVAFAILLVVGAIWLMDRMRTWSTLGDCAFTHAPQCRAMLEK